MPKCRREIWPSIDLSIPFRCRYKHISSFLRKVLLCCNFGSFYKSVYKRLYNYQRENTDQHMRQTSKNRDKRKCVKMLFLSFFHNFCCKTCIFKNKGFGISKDIYWCCTDMVNICLYKRLGFIIKVKECAEQKILATETKICSQDHVLAFGCYIKRSK